MRERIVDLLEKIDLAVAESEGVLTREELRPISELRNEIRTRLAYPDDVIVVGLVGGTGSGKSTILNAIAGKEVAVVGSIRPTTDEPTALVPERHKQGLSGYLDQLEVESRVDADRHPWLCLIDLPDTDSVTVSHLHTVQGILPRLDLIAWVVDPEKYRDAAIHRQIRDVAGYQSQFVFILNQVDRLSGPERELVRADLIEALREDGIEDPQVFPTTAGPTAGPPHGIDELVSGLRGRNDSRELIYGKLALDIGAAASHLAGLTSGSSGLDFEKRWAATRHEIAELGDRGQSAEIIPVVTRLVADLAFESGDSTSAELDGIARDVPDLLAEAVLSGEDAAGILTRVETEVGEPVRSILRRRARAHAAISDLVLSVDRLR